jgi:hypothetical protein
MVARNIRLLDSAGQRLPTPPRTVQFVVFHISEPAVCTVGDGTPGLRY